MFTALSKPPEKVGYTRSLLQPYYMDTASIKAAELLDIPEHAEVLDMCAAPGGKSIVIASRMPETAHLISNEFSRERRYRLKRVLNDHLPETFTNRITVTGYDGTKWCLYEKKRFNRIIVDVPCSSERHVLSSEKHLKEWSPSRTKQLSVRATAFICSAYDILKAGGKMVYSTCSISSKENDGVVEKLVKKRKGVYVEKTGLNIGESTQFGTIILPDTHNGLGPLFVSLISKQA